MEGDVTICNIPLAFTAFSNNDLVAGTYLLAASEENRRSTKTHSAGYQLSLEILITFVTT